MSARTTELGYRYGFKEKCRVLCTFEYRKKHYVLYEDIIFYDVKCVPLGCNMWSGAYKKSRKIPNEICVVADTLIRLSKEEPDNYRFDGEDYLIESGSGNSLVITCRGRCGYFDSSVVLKCQVVKFIAEIFIMAALLCIYFFTVGTSWLSTLFPTVGRTVLAAAVCIFEIIGTLFMFFVRDRERDLYSLFVYASFPLGIVTAAGCAKVNTAVLIITVAILALSVLFLFMPKLMSAFRARNRKVKKRNIRKAFSSLYVPAAALTLVCLISVNVFGLSGYTEASEKKNSAEDHDEIMAAYDNACTCINKDVWKDLDSQARVNVLQAICDYECAEELGCETVYVKAGYPKSSSILGEYNHKKRTILINTEHLDGGAVEEVVNTLLHETRHVYQYSVVDAFNKVEKKLNAGEKRLPFYVYAEKLRSNFENYKSGLTDFEDYYNQFAEQDSRDWASIELYMNYADLIYKRTEISIEM